MSLGWLYLVLAVCWFGFLGMVWLSLCQWLAEEVGPEREGGAFEVEPRLVSACRELSELAAKAKEASHG